MVFMVWIGMASFLVPAMSKTWCFMPFSFRKGWYSAGKSFCTSVLNTVSIVPFDSLQRTCDLHDRLESELLQKGIVLRLGKAAPVNTGDDSSEVERMLEVLEMLELFRQFQARSGRVLHLVSKLDAINGDL